MPNERIKRILTLATPIIGGMISQNILNLVDTAMVGSLGSPALAAVGLGSFAVFMSQALVMGISAGVQAISSRRKGEGREDEAALPLNAGLLLVIIIGALLTSFIYPNVGKIFSYLNEDPEVISPGTEYMGVRVLAISFVGMNFAFRGFWNATDRSSIYMKTLIFMHISNIVLNYILIFGNFGMPAYGVYGAGLGTTIANILGTCCYFILGMRLARKQGFCIAFPSKRSILELATISIPAGIQQLFFAAGFTVLYWIIGKVGTKELGAANVLINVMLVAFQDNPAVMRPMSEGTATPTDRLYSTSTPRTTAKYLRRSLWSWTRLQPYPSPTSRSSLGRISCSSAPLSMVMRVPADLSHSS